MDRIRVSLCLLAALFSVCRAASFGSHYGSSSEYLHSNDTMKLVLSQANKNQLHGRSNDRVNLEFILQNNGLAGHFTLQASSEDGFMGLMSTRDTYLGPGVQQTIMISNMIVPVRKEGGKVRMTLTAVRDSGFSKREAPPTGGSGSYPGGSGIGGSGSYPGGSGVGGSGSYPGGSGVGGSGSYPGGSGVGGSGSYPGGSGSYPGGSGVGGSGSYPGGSGIGGSGSYPGGSGSYPSGGGYPGGGGGGSGGSYYDPSRDPSNRREVSLTIEFTVTSDNFEDDDEPWTKVEYFADSSDETCKKHPGEPGCEDEIWGVKFLVQDKKSGLHLINVDPIGREPLGKKIYFRYPNFAIGSTQEHEVVAVASCCTQGMRLRATDVAGVEAAVETDHKGTGGGGLSKTALWGIIGGVAAFVIIIIVVIVVVVCRKKYSPVSQN